MLRKAWLGLKNWCRHSETIAWARAQAALGVGLLVVVMANVDLTPYLSGKGLIAYLIFNAVVTELVRRKNTVVTTEVTPAGETVKVLEKATPHGLPETAGDAGTSAGDA